ncbi:MAG: PD-(D/E)XK nuclease family protein [Nocardioidaceae bacterium]
MRLTAQPTLEGMPEPLYPATPARLATYLDCPRRYRLTYLDRPSPPRGAPWAHRAVGAAVHTALARWWALPLARRVPASGPVLLAAAWPVDGFRDTGQSQRTRLRVGGEVERYLDGVDPGSPPVAVERTVRVATAHASLWGRVDRVDDRDGTGLVVVDYKTGRAVPTATEAGRSTALAVYAAAVSRVLRRRCRRVELHHLPSGAVAGFEHTEATLGAALAGADRVAVELARLDAGHAAAPDGSAADGSFPARVAPRCGWCDVRGSCGPGRSVAAHLPWDGLPDESRGDGHGDTGVSPGDAPGHGDTGSP